MLDRAGYRADFVADGKEAISALESKHYDLVLMDCFMPRMDGFATTRLIRGAGSSGLINPAIPVVALTGLTGKEDRTRCLEAGMNGYVCKPVESDALIAAIEQVLGRAEFEESASQQNENQAEQISADEFLDSIIDKFMEEVPPVIAELRQAVEQEDLVKLQNIGHRLRGATDIMEISSLSECCFALERAGKAGDIMLAGRLASELTERLQKLTATLSD